MRTVGCRACVSVLIMLAAGLPGAMAAQAQDYTRSSEPKLFNYDELVQLSLDQEMSPELAEKLRLITTTPFINNEAYLSGTKPRPLDVPGLGPTLRVAFWNIERGLELDYILLMLNDKDAFIAKVAEERKKAKESGKRIRNVEMDKIAEEIETLKAADVWILNEVDWGVKRTDYREVVREMGKALNMNWAYGVEFLEIDPKQLGTDKFDDGETKAEQQDLLEVFHVDKDRLKAMHGNAVLSRYPIRDARLVPFTVGYDWFNESKIRPLEKAKRKAALVIGEDLAIEVRRGQRSALYVDLDIPEAPSQRVTVVSTHLENRTTKGIQWTTGVGLVYTAAKAGRSMAKIEYRVDPTSANIPGASSNLERGLFNSLEKYRFEDGHAFDFRGVPEHSTNAQAGTLADSDQRQKTGFTPTYTPELIWGKVRVARFKLDWIFVKSELHNPRDPKGPYLFEPEFGRTLVDLNNCPPEPISDHSPMTVDLPFHEPIGLKAEVPEKQKAGKS
jgi:hypothetical protein